MEIVEQAVGELLSAHPPEGTDERTFLGAQFDAGLAFVSFPVGYGGLGLSRSLQPLISELLADAGAPVNVDKLRRNTVGYGSAAPTILSEGSEEQRQRYLRALFTCEDVWCQLFSEPGAGSDLAGLATRAERDGDDWVVNGQKVWTTAADIARFGLLLARTDPQAEKHKGLTYFVVEMTAPGVEIHPLRELTGSAEFNEVFLTDVRIPDSERLSEIGNGWRTAIVTLMNERTSIGGKVPPRGAGAIGAALELWRSRRGVDPVRRSTLASLWIEAEALRLTNLRAAAAARAGNPGPEGSIAKLVSAELNQRINEFCFDLQGAESLLFDAYERGADETVKSMPTWGYLWSRSDSIRGGTTDIMRNILSERMLGFPSEVRVDKGLPWSEVPRG